MVKWIYNSLFLEHQELLFIISIIVIIIIIVVTIYLVYHELKRGNNANM